MTNLLITILSIALTGMISVMVIYYGNSSYQYWTDQSRATTLIQQSKQLYSLANQYMLDKALGSYADFNISSMYNSSGYFSGIPPIITLPPFPNTGNNSTATFIQNFKSDLSTGADFDEGKGYVNRTTCNLNGTNIIFYRFFINDPVTGGWTTTNGFWNSARTSHPVIRMCQALNTLVGLPAGLSYAASGIPYAPSDSTLSTACSGSGVTQSDGVAPGTTSVFNYCFLSVKSGSTVKLFYQFTN